jgi:glycerophosphoryl diester phosphodiesterase
MLKSVIVYINAPQQFKDWRALAPKIPLMISLPDTIKTPEALNSFLDTYSPDILDGDHGDYTAAMVAAAKAKGIPVWPDIQSAEEGPQDWAPALQKGFSGLQTDHPALLVQYLKKQGRR